MTEVATDEYSDSHFYKKAWTFGAPIALSHLMTSLLGVIDTKMVSGLGNIAVAAVGVSTNFAFLLIMISFGFLSGLSIFVAQYWGSKDIGNIHKVFIIALIIGTFISLFFFIAGFFFPEFIIGLYNNSGNEVNSVILNNYGVEYLRVASFSYFTMTITFVIAMIMRSVERVIYPQAVAIFTVLLNTLLNYTLIKGNFGFEAYGVKGAAIATLISSGIGTVLLILYLIKSKEEVFKIKFNVYKNISYKFIKKISEKALPVAINEMMWGLGVSMYLIAFGFISTDSITSVHISNQIMGLFWVTNAGISSACAIMLGNKLGEGKLDLAKKWGIKFTKLSVVAGLIFGVILFVLSDYISMLYPNTSTGVQENISTILKVFSFYIPIKFSNALHIVGTLRAGGDTKFVLFAEIGPLWLIGVPLAFILSIFSSLPLYLIIAIVNIEEIVKFFLVLTRFLQYKWVRNLTIE